MKKNKRNKKDIITLISVLFLTLLVLVVSLVINNKLTNVKDNNEEITFKSEYESLNGEKVGDYTYPEVTVDEENPFVISSAKKVINTLKSGTGMIYIGYPKCPWCRNAVNVLNYLNTSEILYLNIYEHRDTYELVDGNVTKTKEGSEEYYELLQILNNELMEYTLNVNNDSISVGEKRIYVPMVIGVKNGQIVGYHIDTVTLNEGQTPFDLLTKTQQEELLGIYESIKNKVYDDACNIDLSHGC